MCFYHAILFALKNEIIISLTHNFATAIIYKLRKKRGNRKYKASLLIKKK